MKTLKGSPNINTDIAANNDKDLVELADLHAYTYPLFESVLQVKDSLNSIVIELPCIEEQNKIAHFLSAVDKRINIEENRLNLLRDQKQAFIQQMFIQ